MGFMGLLQRAGVLKAIISSPCLSNFRDLYNLHHLVRRWCTTTHTFFFSYGKLTVTLKDVANQFLLPILGDTNPTTLEFSPKKEAIETNLKKRMGGNAKLSYWASSSSKFSVTARHKAFVVFGFVNLFWVPPLLCHKALILSFSHQNICRGEPAVGRYVLGASKCPVRHPVE